jgi:hypothetical protein
LASAQNEQDELTGALSLWQGFNSDAYYFEILTTFESNTKPVQFGVQVRENAVTEIKSFDYNMDVDDTSVSSMPTIEGLFESIQAGIDAGAAVQVTYDKENGYPSEFRVEYNSGPDPALIGSITFFLPVAIKMEEFRMAKTQWASFNSKDYDMVYRNNGFLPPPLSSEVRVEVRNEAVTKVTVVESFLDVTDAFGSLALTIDGIFGRLETAMATSNMVDIRISYSSTYGYPESVYIDFLKLVADEELSFSVLHYEPAQQDLDL